MAARLTSPGFVFYTITRESIFYVNLRQAYFLSPSYASRISSRTVLFTSVTKDYLSVDKIRQMFGQDKVKNVWLATDTAELEEMEGQRQDAAMKLEGAETTLVTLANAARLKALKKQQKQGDAAVEDGARVNDAAVEEPDDESGSVAARWIKPSDRPTHRLTMLVGKKVDTINWARSEVERLTPEVEELQAKHRAGGVDLVSAVFVEFHAQADAQAAYQSVAHNLPLHMAPRYIGLDPGQVIWSNLRIQWWERIIRYSISVGIVVALIIFWAIPTAVVGAISNISFLTNKVPFLSFITEVPGWIMGVITGLLPTILMAVLMALVPIFMRFMAKFGGDPTTAAVELTTQNYYFAFQVVQVFLVVTLASAASSVATKIVEDPTKAATLLATNIPKSSNFYISYITLQGLSFSAGALLQIVALLLSKILGKLLDKTPRKKFDRWSGLAKLGWGTVFPAFTLLAVVAITYSCIQPLVLGFATIGLYLFYFAYRYDVLYVSNTNIDTQGKVYTQALQHLTVGCYLLMVCLIGLFAIGSASDRMALGPLILEIIFLVFVVLYHMSLKSAMEPLINFLPKNLEHEEQALLSQERSVDGKPIDDQLHGTHPGSSEKNGIDGGNANVDSAEKGMDKSTADTAAPDQGNFLVRYFRPDKYESYERLRKLVPSSHDETEYPAEAERDAYFHPSITSTIPLLWIPRDEMGVSKQEVQHTSKVTPITDEDAWLDEKNNIQWGANGLPPIYEEPVNY